MQFADDITICTNGNSIESVILSLEKDLSNTMYRFRVNHIAANRGKCQVLLLWMREEPKFTLEINDITIPLMDKVKLLGVMNDSKLKFDNHIKALCKTANKKISAFLRVAIYLNYEKGKILYNTFIILTIALRSGCIMGRHQAIG